LQYNIDLGKGDKWFESRMVRMGDKILSVVRDITDLKRAQFEAEEISGRLISAHEDERARIALELHDDACQSLAVLGIELELFNRIPLDQETVIRAKRQLLAAHVDELSSHLRRLSHQLHPSWISAVGLVTAVHGFCTEMENAHGLEIKFVEAKVPRPLPDPISLNIYRIVQEALQNVARHSGAKEAAVTIFGNDRTLQLSISDNGCGFDTGITARGGSLGLISVRERVRLMHGSLSIDSGPGRGTRIDATIPIKLS
jgi:signal transduction histidine kinase